MREIPYIIDIDDDLERAQAEATVDIDDDVNHVREQLDEYVERDRGDRGGFLETMENDLLRLEEQTEDSARERIRSARNRIHIYRDSRSTATNPVTIIETKARQAAENVDAPARADDEVEFWLTLTNEDNQSRTVTIQITLFGEDGDRVAKPTAQQISIGGTEQKTVTVVATVPDDTDFYTARIMDE